MLETSKRPRVVGQFIRNRRENLKLSQRSLGQLFDPPVTTQFVSNVERGVTPLPPNHVGTIARALQISETELLAVMEQEYRAKISGKIGASSDGLASSLNFGMSAGTVGAPEYDFIRSIYEAYRSADTPTQQAFMNVCENMLHVQRRGAQI
jgi:transcriptional regulator with XRE-family HTH domain